MKTDTEEQIMTPAQVASLLECSTRTVRRLVSHKGLPQHNVGRSARYLRSEVEAWIRKCQ